MAALKQLGFDFIFLPVRHQGGQVDVSLLIPVALLRGTALDRHRTPLLGFGLRLWFRLRFEVGFIDEQPNLTLEQPVEGIPLQHLIQHIEPIAYQKLVFDFLAETVHESVHDDIVQRHRLSIIFRSQ